MARKKKDEDAKPEWTPKHAAVQVSRPDADVYYIDAATRERYEARKK